MGRLRASQQAGKLQRARKGRVLCKSDLVTRLSKETTAGEGSRSLSPLLWCHSICLQCDAASRRAFIGCSYIIYHTPAHPHAHTRAHTRRQILSGCKLATCVYIMSCTRFKYSSACSSFLRGGSLISLALVGHIDLWTVKCTVAYRVTVGHCHPTVTLVRPLCSRGSVFQGPNVPMFRVLGYLGPMFKCSRDLFTEVTS